LAGQENEKMTKIIVKYWRGTLRLEDTAESYDGAMEIATKNQNAYPPRFYTETGEELHDDGNCLVTESEIERQAREPSTALRAYA
jgi:hypothetical protein